MSAADLVELVRQALLVAFYLALPPVAAAALAGFATGVLQSTTGQSDTAVSTAPRLLAALLAVIIFGMWMVSLAAGFWHRLWSSLPQMIG